MATFKSLVGRVRTLERDEQGAAGSIEVIGAVAVGVLILAATLKMMLGGGEEGDGGILGTVKENLTALIGGTEE